MEKRKCETCGKEFEPHAHNQLFCSLECRAKSRAVKAETRKCLQCGKEFTTVRRDKKFCSAKCYKARYKQEYKKPKPLRKCPICGKEFEPKTGGQKYCTAVCCEKAHGHPNVRARQCTCKRCGKKFTAAWNVAHCQKCAELLRQEKKAVQIKVDAATGKPVKTLADWTREARECNLDYGTYRGLIAMGKTFDELKANADRRSMPAHAHANKGMRHSNDNTWGMKVG